MWDVEISINCMTNRRIFLIAKVETLVTHENAISSITPTINIIAGRNNYYQTTQFRKFAYRLTKTTHLPQGNKDAAPILRKEPRTLAPKTTTQAKMHFITG